MKSVKAVLSDLDDTLLMTMEIKWQQHIAIANERYGVDLLEATIRQHWGKPFTQMLEHFYEGHPTPVGLLDAYRETSDRFQKGVFPNALTTVNALRTAGIEVGVITSAPTQDAVRELIRHGFPVDELVLVQGEDAHPAHKPDPGVFNPALALLKDRGIAREETVYVGDSVIDLEAAKAAGLRFFGVATGLYGVETLLEGGADGAGPEISELIPWLAAEGQS